MDKNKIPKYWSEQFKSLTGLEPTEKDYVGKEHIFQPRNEYEKDPVLTIIKLIFLFVFVVCGLITVLYAN